MEQIVDFKKIKEIPGLLRIETNPKDEIQGVLLDYTHSVYKHEEIYGKYCTIQDYVDCPPEKAYEYLKNTYSLEEWTFSVRDFKKTNTEGLYVGKDKIGDRTKIYCKTIANPEAMTVDYHCAWDQGQKLWMIYLMRIIPAEPVLNRPGCVVLWTNCHHPFYDKNPEPGLAPPGRPWIGEFWDMFYAGHWIELQNLKRILEYRHKNKLPIGPNLLTKEDQNEDC